MTGIPESRKLSTYISTRSIATYLTRLTGIGATAQIFLFTLITIWCNKLVLVLCRWCDQFAYSCVANVHITGRGKATVFAAVRIIHTLGRWWISFYSAETIDTNGCWTRWNETVNQRTVAINSAGRLATGIGICTDKLCDDTWCQGCSEKDALEDSHVR